MADEQARAHHALQLRLARLSYLASMDLLDRGEGTEQDLGDARRALALLDLAARSTAANGGSEITSERIDHALAADASVHAAGVDCASLADVFTRSMRASDPDAALYWMLRMLYARVDPQFVVRRMIVFASEDIGTADPQALALAITVDQAVHRLGMPEALHSLGQCCVYLARAPKSQASYLALQRAEHDVREHGPLPIPLKPADAQATTYLPSELLGRKYYCPTDQSFESLILERLDARKRG